MTKPAGVDPPTVGGGPPGPVRGHAGLLGARFAIYAVVVALVSALRTGRNAVRWSLAVLLGGRDQR